MEPSQDGRHVGEAAVDQFLRRTGAGFFSRSGAVGDDPGIFLKLIQMIRQVSQRDRESARDVTGGIG